MNDAEASTADAWFYCDADGVWQGPCTWPQLAQWRAAGYLAPRLALLRGTRVSRLDDESRARQSDDERAQWLYCGADGCVQSRLQVRSVKCSGLGG